MSAVGGSIDMICLLQDFKTFEHSGFSYVRYPYFCQQMCNHKKYVLATNTEKVYEYLWRNFDGCIDFAVQLHVLCTKLCANELLFLNSMFKSKYYLHDKLDSRAKQSIV